MVNVRAFETRYDAVIVGARCAGAATAMLLARAGAKVLLIDRQQYGSDVVSTHALMRTAIIQLSRWRLLADVVAAGTPVVGETTFHYGQETTRVIIKPEHGVEFLCAPRRTVLDRILVDAAIAAGAEVRHGISMTNLQFGPGGQVIGAILKDENGDRVTVRSDIVVGADGRQSTVAKRVDARSYTEAADSSGYAYGYFANIVDNGFHWYFNDGVAAGAIPTNDGLHCVFVGVHRDRFAETFRKDLYGGFVKVADANSPRLGYVVRNASLVGRLRGYASLAGFFRQSYGPGWALVGDAGYFKDPLTAHGITDAFRDAELLAHAILEGGTRALARYQEERDHLSRPLFDVTAKIATFAWSMDQVKEHHGELSQAMQKESAYVAGFSDRDELAA